MVEINWSNDTLGDHEIVIQKLERNKFTQTQCLGIRF